MRLLISIILICYFQITYAQLHHQAISSQGSTNKTASGILVTQTVGQQSVTGNHSTKKGIVGSGFQKTAWKSLIKSNLPSLKILIYPNPFQHKITFVVPTSMVNKNAELSLFDVSGKMVFSATIFINETSINQNLELLPSGAYLVLLRSDMSNYYSKLIKQ